MSREEVLAAVRRVPAGQDFVWDGSDDDDRPATEEEIQAALDSYRARRGRPAGSDKTQIARRVDSDTLAAFKATGRGWQTRMNPALRDWLKGHSLGVVPSMRDARQA